ncbi:GNAT family N-acetyltransferase [Photobacterium nomapromontoriensis]|uniref:GNAT family N-acetyltransferase n=1 Tax=Photobacterium nomapromontoriensis TaxID=2910237 RepID=UPI003D1365A9
MHFQYIKDTDVSEALDRQIRRLLSTCFVKGDDAEIFSRQRYYNEMPQHRYMLWENNDLVAHIAVHDKQVFVNGSSQPICGIAEVCVHPEHRGKGAVKQLLGKIHHARIANGDAFSILFGDEEVYASSGYHCINNLKALNLSKEWLVTGHTMVHSLNKKWPDTEVKLVGVPF